VSSNLRGKVALITGGGTGIGAAIARRFVADGARICIAGRREEYLDQVARSLPSEAVAKCPGDVSNPADAERMVATALSLDGHLDVLVNCAGTRGEGSVAEVSLEEWRRVWEVNVTGPFLLMKAAIPLMIRNGGGSIINIGSLAGLRAIPSALPYCVSKSALIMLTQQAALDYGPAGIRCNLVCPGLVRTPMTEPHFAELAGNLGLSAEALLGEGLRNVPLRRPGAPEEIAGICSFLASDDSSYITGAVIVVDGGTAIVDAFGAGISRVLSGS
jgi:NAD(P)-dependent dehydrogenase (short-subunit alcohol dehydrogenase family)